MGTKYLIIGSGNCLVSLSISHFITIRIRLIEFTRDYIKLLSKELYMAQILYMVMGSDMVTLILMYMYLIIVTL